MTQCLCLWFNILWVFSFKLLLIVVLPPSVFHLSLCIVCLCFLCWSMSSHPCLPVTVSYSCLCLPVCSVSLSVPFTLIVLCASLMFSVLLLPHLVMCDYSQLCYICGLLEVNGCVQRPSIRPHVLISSLPVDTPGPVGDQNERESDTDEEEGRPPTAGRKRRDRDDELLNLKEDMQHQREAEESREWMDWLLLHCGTFSL